MILGYNHVKKRTIGKEVEICRVKIIKVIDVTRKRIFRCLAIAYFDGNCPTFHIFKDKIIMFQSIIGII